MSEMILRAVGCCEKAMDLVDSMSADERAVDEIRVRLEKVVQSLRGFEKRAFLKTRRGSEAAQEIEEAAVTLEKGLGSLGSTDLSRVVDELSTLEQRVEALEKTIERMKRVVT